MVDQEPVNSMLQRDQLFVVSTLTNHHGPFEARMPTNTFALGGIKQHYDGACNTTGYQVVFEGDHSVKGITQVDLRTHTAVSTPLIRTESGWENKVMSAGKSSPQGELFTRIADVAIYDRASWIDSNTSQPFRIWKVEQMQQLLNGGDMFEGEDIPLQNVAQAPELVERWWDNYREEGLILPHDPQPLAASNR